MRLRILAGIAALCMVVTGCSSEVETEPEAKGEVVIAMEPSASYQANAATIGYVLKYELGYDVTFHEVENATAAWEALQAGTVDVIAEDWGIYQSRLADEKAEVPVKDYARMARYTGVKGTEGWYVATSASEKYGLGDVEGLKLSASQIESDGGLVVPADHDQKLEKSKLSKAELEISVKTSKSDSAFIEQVRSASDSGKSTLFYFKTPNWLIGELGLVPVDLESAGIDYPATELVTVVSRDFAAEGGDAFGFIQNFNWTETDQNQVAYDISQSDMAPEAAAKKWLDLHSDQWQTWITV